MIQMMIYLIRPTCEACQPQACRVIRCLCTSSIFFFVSFFLVSLFYFPASEQKLWSQVPSLSPPRLRAFNFYRAQGTAFPLLVGFHRRLPIHVLVPTNFIRVCTRGDWKTHANWPNTRHEDNLPHHRGDRWHWSNTIGLAKDKAVVATTARCLILIGLYSRQDTYGNKLS